MDDLISICCGDIPVSYFQIYEVDGCIMGVCFNCMDHAEFKETDDGED